MEQKYSTMNTPIILFGNGECPTHPLVLGTINKAKTHLIYDRKLDNGEREGIKMKLPDEYDLEEQITIMKLDN